MPVDVQEVGQIRSVGSRGEAGTLAVRDGNTRTTRLAHGV